MMKISTKYVKFCSIFRSLTNQIIGIDHDSWLLKLKMSLDPS